MNIYAIYIRPNLADSDPMIVKEDWSLVAGIFNIFWALYHKLWQVVIGLVIANAFVLALSEATGYDLLFYWKWLVISGFTLFASDLREYGLNKKGYILDGIVVASSAAEAELRFFGKRNAV